MIATLLLWLVGSLGLASLATPLVYSALDFSAETAAEWPYARVFSRVAMACALLMLLLLRRRFDGRDLREYWRLEGWRQRVPAIALGLGIALIPALCVLPAVVSDGVLRWSPDPLTDRIGRISKGLPGAVTVGFIEEAFFRGIVFLGLLRSLALLPALALSAALYAGIHFLSPREDFVFETGQWPGIGFEYLALVLQRFADPELWRGCLGLFAVGSVLAWSLVRTRSFSLCVGLHAGWYLAAKSGVHLLQFVPEMRPAEWVDKRLHLMGQPWIWLAVLASGVVVAGLGALNSRWAPARGDSAPAGDAPSPAPPRA